jgi:polyhydroxyalkanoate synthase
MLTRLGPRPLPLHLASALTTWLSSPAALPSSRSGSAASKLPSPFQDAADRVAQALGGELAAHPPKAVEAAVGREVGRRLEALVTGIARYRRHPYARTLVDPPAVWDAGTTRLLDYGGDKARPLLVVPSLINRAYILDLSAERSLMRRLAGPFRPFLVDWGRPGPQERDLDLAGYIAGRLGAALDRVHALAGRRPVVVGYCMGGLLAAALAVLRRDDVAGLALLATPWDFHADQRELARALARAASLWLPLVDRLGELPVDGLQALFFALDPLLVARKFLAFAELAPDDPRASEFVALEDWLNDGVPLVARVARECILGWYGENTPGRGVWQVAGTTIAPDAIAAPTLAVIPAQDRIVPPSSAAALAAAIPGAARLAPPLGHIGMIVSARAPEQMWAPLVAWLGARL